MLWSGKMRKQVASQYPGLQFGEVSKKLGDLWKRIPDKEKQVIVSVCRCCATAFFGLSRRSAWTNVACLFL